jgi:spore coat polysaccharide biosynthesis predicted glycosyltransferase SpsG
MKKTTIIYLLMFLCSFVLPSYTIQQDSTKKEHTIQRSSEDIVVNLKFQNPEVIVTDSRSSSVLERKFDSQAMDNKALVDEMKMLNNNLYVHFITSDSLSKERRYESVMDRLRTVTGYNELQINKFFKQERTTNILYALVTILFAIASLVIYNTSFRRLKGLTLVPIATCVTLWIIVIVTLYFLLPALYGVEYQKFFQLLQHSPL